MNFFNYPTGGAIGDAQTMRNVDTLVITYHKAFNNRYKVSPANQPHDGDVLRWLLNQFDFIKCQELIEKYLKMPGNKDWFVTKGHDLKTFKDNINVVTAELGKYQAQAMQSHGIRIKTELICAGCRNKHFTWIGAPDELPHVPMCNDCTGEQA